MHLSTRTGPRGRTRRVLTRCHGTDVVASLRAILDGGRIVTPRRFTAMLDSGAF